MQRFEEQYQAVRGELRYFALYATDVGVLQATISRSEDNKKTDKYSGKSGAGKTDYIVDSKLFTPASPSGSAWRWIASLLYSECQGQDLPMHSVPAMTGVAKLRADADRVTQRSIALLTAHRAVSAVVVEEHAAS